MTRFRTPTIALVVALLAMACAEFGAAAPEKSGPAPVEGLGDRLLGDWGLPPSADPGSSAGRVPLPNVDESRRQLDSPSKAEQAGEDLGKRGTSPLERISNRMHEAHQLIESQTTSGETKRVQEAIVSDLDELIEQLSQQCKNCSGGQCKNPGQQQQQTSQSAPKPGEGKKSATSSTAQAAAQQSQAPGEGGKPADPGELSNDELVKQLWGQLPQHMRQQLLQSSADEFLPKYRRELEEYYRKLSEEERGEPGAR